MAKKNKRRMDARLKPYIWDRIERLSEVYQATYTEIVEMCLEKGLNWYASKIRKELDPAFQWKEQAPVQVDYTKSTEEILKEQEIERLAKIAKTPWIDD